MHGVLPADPQRSIFPGPISGIETSIDPTNGIFGAGWFADVARRLWKQKATAALHHYTGAPNTTCHRWQRGDSEIASSAVRRMLHSADGRAILFAIMAGCAQPWWIEVQRGLGLVRAFEIEQRRFAEQLDLGLD